jgi:Protein of unknown function (DUF3017)
MVQDRPTRRRATTVAPRAQPRRFGEWPFVLVLLVAAVAMTLVATNHVKCGCVVLGMALGLAAVLRAILPARVAGLLAVRSRAFDIIATASLGAVLVALSVVVPPPS